MARVNQRPWKVPGQRGKRKAWGFTVQVGGRQKRVYKSEWTRDNAEKALAAFLLKVEEPKAKTSGLTFAQAIERYLAAKAKKRSLDDDRRLLEHLKLAFGADSPLADITAGRISAYKIERLRTQVRRDGEQCDICPATLNRELAVLRHLFRLASEEWELVSSVPRIRLEKEPQGRLRWLTGDEAMRLLDACRESRNPDLTDLVEFALFTGLRRGEALGLTWDRVDRARGVILLNITKNHRRREVPLNGRADAVLSRRGVSMGGDLVFGTKKWDHFRSAWGNAVERAKLADFHFHDLRHTFASWAVQAGATLQEVKELLGHHSLAMVLRYSHLSPEHLRSAVARLDAVVPAALPASDSTQDSTQQITNEVWLLSK